MNMLQIMSRHLLSALAVAIPITACDTGGSAGVVIFHSDRDGSSEIYRIAADGSDERRLTNNDAYDGFPSWSPDGSKILFHSDRNGRDAIYVMNADGSNQRPIADTEAGRYAKWSPDGAKVAFFAEHDGVTDIFVVESDGGGLRNLTNSSSTDETPSWTADSRRLAFQSDRKWRTVQGDDQDGRVFGIYTMSADGGDVVEVTGTDFNDENPSISPTGDRIVYQSYVGEGLAIVVSNVKSKDRVMLTSPDDVNASPAFSSSGDYIVFDSLEDGNFEIFIMKSDGRERRQLTFTDGDVENSGAAMHDCTNY